MLRRMRDEKKFMCGEEMTVEPRFFIGAAENPFADPFEFRVMRLAKKVMAGADFIQTQLIYNVEKFARWMEMVRDMDLHKKVYVMAGVGPIKSAGAARYMKNKVPGMDVPDEIVERLQAASDPKEEGIKICLDIINQVRSIEGVSGIHIMAIEWETSVPDIVERSGLLPRPSLN
jgi:methylenetetrahydrofolate reductase (NADPH)